MSDDFFRAYLKSKAGLSDEALNELKSTYSVKNYNKGDLIKAQGDYSSIYFVQNGLLRLFGVDENAKEHILQFAPEGWWITDRTGLYQSQNSKFNIDAYEESSAIQIDVSFFEKASCMSSNFQKFSEKILHNHIENLYSRVYLLIGTPVKERYLNFIKTYSGLYQRIPQWMIASYLGVTPEGLSRVRKTLYDLS